MFVTASTRKPSNKRIQKHIRVLLWKSYLLRKRRWRLFLIELVFSAFMYLLAGFMARTVFLTPVRTDTGNLTQLDFGQIKSYLGDMVYFGYAPSNPDIDQIMKKFSQLLDLRQIREGDTEEDLNNELYSSFKGKGFNVSVIWILWKTTQDNAWRIKIRSSERAKMMLQMEGYQSQTNQYLESGFLAVQMALSQAILEHHRSPSPNYEIRSSERAKMMLQMEGYQSQTNQYLESGFLAVQMALSQAILEHHRSPSLNYEIRSSERAKMVLQMEGYQSQTNQYLESGFLAVQMALSQAILEHHRSPSLNYELVLKSMPTSPLMQEERVRDCLSWILVCFTLALMPPVMETEALVVTETARGFKRALRLRRVDFTSIYGGWVLYGHMSALPACLMGAVLLIFIFRWTDLAAGFAFVLAYETVMIMLGMLMALFHKRALASCIWSLMLVLLQTFMAELLVQHTDMEEGARSIAIHLIIPPLGLVNGLNHFALLEIGKEEWTSSSLVITIVTWVFISVVYFALLMLLQRVLGHGRAIGGQVSWRSIIFKKPKDPQKLHPVEKLTGKERDQLQEVDELVAKAISFHSVTKRTLGKAVLKDITFDIYRGEYTMLYAKTVNNELIQMLENIITGLTLPDEGYVTTLGCIQQKGHAFLAVPHMLGYCHSSKVLLEELTVEEHLQLFMQICTWNESTQYCLEYEHIRSRELLQECELTHLKYTQVKKLSLYYKAQLCWALALLLEPRIIFIPWFEDKPSFVAVITDKIVRYRRHLTIVQTCESSMQLENADRVFIFDNKSLMFGGTMPYFFFKYGRDYRLRLVVKTDSGDEMAKMKQLRAALATCGASVRAHFGSLLILRIPVSPTADALAVIRYLHENAELYGITSMNLALPDTEEVCTRAIMGNETEDLPDTAESEVAKEALERIKNQRTSESVERSNGNFYTNFSWIKTKFKSFHIYYRFYFILTIIACVIAGVYIGRDLGKGVIDMYEGIDVVLNPLDAVDDFILTAEALKRKTTFVLRSDNDTDSLSVTDAYIFSLANETSSQLSYIALSSEDSLDEYLMIGATLEPQEYVIQYAYGMDVAMKNGVINIAAIYSPLHMDKAASARSLGRAYQSLLRHYTGALNAIIEMEDVPLLIDITPMKSLEEFPQLVIPTVVLLTVCHVTLLPSQEHGYIRHTQNQARNFSPFQYWTTLWMWDLVTYSVLVIIMSVVVIVTILLLVPYIFEEYVNLVIVPTVLMVYGFGSIPQAYLFSLSPHTSLNTVIYIIVNIVFGESTVMTRMFEGAALDFMMLFIYISPQFNFAFALMKITNIFIYNTECLIFWKEDYCKLKIIHRCCAKCGLLEPCFERKRYLTFEDGVLSELIFIVATGGLFFVLLMLWEYKYFKRWMILASVRWLYAGDTSFVEGQVGAMREKRLVLKKLEQLRRNEPTPNPFGSRLLVNELSDKKFGRFVLKNIYFGLGPSDALAVSGLRRHGREDLCDVLSGFKLPSGGNALVEEKWKLRGNPHMYSRNVSLSCERPPLPEWMTVRNALLLIAVLRGVPDERVQDEVQNYIEALELTNKANSVIHHLPLSESKRLHFAAAVIGAPPVVILDECTAHQPTSVRRAMYLIMDHLRELGHALLLSSARVESHLPVTDRLAIMVNGHIFELDRVDRLLATYRRKGYTVVLHLKDEVDFHALFRRYFVDFVVNDTAEVLVNIQVLDDISWLTLFEKMEQLQEDSPEVYTYVVSAVPIDYIYNTIVSNEAWNIESREKLPCCATKCCHRKRRQPDVVSVEQLNKFPKKYDITRLVELPWSVIFQR